MPNQEIITTGFDDLNAILRGWTGEGLKKSLRRAQRAALRPVLREAKRLAPIGETGDLQRAVKLRAARRKRNRVVHRVTIEDRDLQNEQGVFYGGFVHWDTQDENGNVIPGDDFLKQAADNTQNQVGTIMVAVMIREFAN